MTRREGSWQRWELVGLFVTLLLGNLLHFVYDWSGSSTIAATFAAVNESTWEHIRLFTVPWILWSLVECIALAGRGLPVLQARMLGLLVGMAAIPFLFYTVRYGLGIDSAVVNVAIFQVSVLLAYGASYAALHYGKSYAVCWIMSLLLMAAVAVVTVLWTFAPPDLPLFADPVNGTRGIVGTDL